MIDGLCAGRLPASIYWFSSREYTNTTTKSSNQWSVQHKSVWCTTRRFFAVPDNFLSKRVSNLCLRNASLLSNVWTFLREAAKKNCRGFPYLNLCSPAYFVKTNQLIIYNSCKWIEFKKIIYSLYTLNCHVCRSHILMSFLFS